MLSYDKLAAIAELIYKYLPSVKSIGSFARITDVTPKTEEELAKLRDIGYDSLTIGIETGDDEALRFMNKGYASADIIEQCQRLDAAGINYSFFYLVSISGAGRGEIGAELTADICNQQLPKDKKKLLSFLGEIIGNVNEEELKRYRRSVRHL